MRPTIQIRPSVPLPIKLFLIAISAVCFAVAILAAAGFWPDIQIIQKKQAELDRYIEINRRYKPIAQ
jgi:hypothetical protein